jgi:hypothetical protein
VSTIDTDTATREELVAAIGLLSDEVVRLRELLADAVPMRWLTREQRIEVALRQHLAGATVVKP